MKAVGHLSAESDRLRGLGSCRQGVGLALCLGLFTSSCGPPGLVENRNGLEVRISTDRERYEPGEALHVRIANLGASPVYVDTCSLSTEGEVREGYWSGSLGYGGCGYYEAPPDSPELFEIKAGATFEDTLAVHSRAYRGSWRVHLRLFDGRGQRLTSTPSHSNIFTVTRGPLPSETGYFRFVLSGSDSANAFIAARQVAHDRD